MISDTGAGEKMKLPPKDDFGIGGGYHIPVGKKEYTRSGTCIPAGYAHLMP
ncbi:hypothetical protein ACFL35_20560 [Candidatus Riflebacteria bacterium]